MATRKRKDKDTSVRCFEVSDPTMHPKGYTIYKVTCKIIKADCPEAPVKEYVLWKRYNDFKKLYKALSYLHKALHRKEEFPPFARAQMFGRFDDNVIAERRQSAQDLLNFVAHRPYLINDKSFKLFYQGAREVIAVQGSSTDVTSSYPGILQPHIFGMAARDSSIDSASVASTEDSLSIDITQNLRGTGISSREDPEDGLGGVWRCRQEAENISLNSNDLEEDEQTDFTDDSALSTPLPEADISFFDPIAEVADSDSGSSGQYSNQWLLSALSVLEKSEKADESGTESTNTDELCSDTYSKSEVSSQGGENQKDIIDSVIDDSMKTVFLSVDSVPVTNKESGEVLVPEEGSVQRQESHDSSSSQSMPLSQQQSFVDEFDPLRPKSRTGSVVGAGKGDLTFSVVGGPEQTVVPSVEKDVKPKEEPIAKGVSPNVARRFKGKSPRGSPRHSPSHSPLRQSLHNLDLKDKGDYIYYAASQISLAQQCEANGNFNMAFSYYKSGVGILLTGVQDDDNKARRDAVRRKTARYLMKAEDIYNRHMARSDHDENRWDTGAQVTLTVDLDPTVACLQGHICELKSYRVLGIIDHVMLVMDKTTESTYVIKVLYKSASSGSQADQVPNIIPQLCPFMVNLYKFYEAEHAIYLLLQHATGGKLWSYVGAYLHQQRDSDLDVKLDLAGNLGISYSSTPPETNIYSGQQLMPKDESSSTEATASNSVEIPGQGHSQGHTNSSVDSDLKADPDCASSYVQLLTDYDATADGQGQGEVKYIKDSNNRGREPDKDNRDSLSLDVSQSKLQLQKQVLDVKAMDKHANHSLSSDETLEADRSRDTSTSELPEGQDSNFDDLLRNTKPLGVELFSISSFDSDHCVRFDSATSDHIESIPEGSEGSPEQKIKSNVTTPVDDRQEVFYGGLVQGPVSDGAGSSPNGIIQADNNNDTVPNVDDVIQSSKELIKSVERVLSESDSIGEAKDVMEVESARPRRSSTPLSYLDDSATGIKNTQGIENLESDTTLLQGGTSCVIQALGVPKGASILSDSLEEPSIYDSNRTPVSQPSSDMSPSRSPNPASFLSDSPQHRDSFGGNIQSPKNAHIVSKVKEAFDSEAKRPASLGTVYENGKVEDIEVKVPEHKKLLRKTSREQKFETVSRTRKRTLSNVFGELDLAAGESKTVVHLPESCVRQWIAEILIAVSRLHAMGIVCRDLRPANILLGDKGHVLLTYFSQWNNTDKILNQEAVDNLYVAPEVLGVSGVSPACDWWSLGVLLYEMLTGESLVSCHPSGLTSHSQLHIPDHVSPEAASLLQELLRSNPSERLGYGPNGAEDIKHQPFFTGIDWKAMSR